jgi:hypothetical protein
MRLYTARLISRRFQPEIIIAAAVSAMVALGAIAQICAAPSIRNTRNHAERALEQALGRRCRVNAFEADLNLPAPQWRGIALPIVTSTQRRHAASVYATVVSGALSRFRAVEAPRISSSQRFELCSPRPGALMAVGDTVAIQWRTGAGIDQIVIELAGTGDQWHAVASLAVDGDGGFQWIVPERLPGGAMMPGHCTLRIRTPDFMHKAEAAALTITTITDRASVEAVESRTH